MKKIMLSPWIVNRECTGSSTLGKVYNHHNNASIKTVYQHFPRDRRGSKCAFCTNFHAQHQSAISVGHNKSGILPCNVPYFMDMMTIIACYPQVVLSISTELFPCSQDDDHRKGVKTIFASGHNRADILDPYWDRCKSWLPTAPHLNQNIEAIAGGCTKKFQKAPHHPDNLGAPPDS